MQAELSPGVPSGPPPVLPPALPPAPPPEPPAAAARRLRDDLAAAVHGLAQRPATLLPGPPAALGERGAGHFHLVPELFLQATGHTDFSFPGGGLRLAPGQALLLPPLLLHAERVQPGASGQPFGNLVIQADAGRVTCHLAHEAGPGRPGILHLAACQHEQAGAVQSWLLQAARLGAQAQHDTLAAVQAQALVCAAAAAVLRLLDDQAAAPTEPPLVARLRVLVQNQLGDATLSVRRLAAQSGCSADHLSAVFVQATGEHLAACITRLRLARAADLLRQTDMHCKQVAWACGYARHSYFSQCFRRAHGATPQAWRAGLPSVA